MRDIKVALQEHYDKVYDKVANEKFPLPPIVLGVFLYGSQNYNIATENSDVDTIAILIPTFEDLNIKKPVSQEIHFENGEHCVIKDIREVVKQWKKQSLNYLEILFTDHFLIQREWAEDWDNLFVKNREDITHMDIDKTIKAVSAQAIHTLLQDETNYKKQANALRMYYFLSAFVEGKSYKECLTTSCKEVLDIKEGKTPFPFKSTQSFIDAINKIKEGNKNNFLYNNKEINSQLDKNLVNFVWRTIVF